MDTVTLYHGTDNHNAERIIRDGLNQNAFGHVYVTEVLDTARNYAVAKAMHYRIPQHKSLWLPDWQLRVDKEDGEYRPDSSPVVIELEITRLAWLWRVGADPTTKDGICIQGTVPARFITGVAPVPAWFVHRATPVSQLL
jgi:RNA:NAD 2'-phosphotransferase (TPT1/KptA family)